MAYINNLGSITPDNLIVDSKARLYVDNVLIAPGQSLERGTVLGKSNITKQCKMLQLAPAPAKKDIGGIHFVAKIGGTTGNSITLVLSNPLANSSALSVSVSSNAITVSLATGSAGALTSTLNDIVAAVNDSAAASALVMASLAPGSTGTTIAAAVASTALVGGAAGATDGTEKVYAVLCDDVVTTSEAVTAEAYLAGCFNIDELHAAEGVELSALTDQARDWGLYFLNTK